MDKLKRIILFGASNFSNEVVQLIRDINKICNTYEIVGLLDDDYSYHGSERNGIKVLGGFDWLQKLEDRDFKIICCIGNPKVKKKIVDKIIEIGIEFTSIIHPSVIISETSSYGNGCIIAAGNIITTNVEIANHVILNLACTIGHNSVINDFSTINPGVNLSGDVTIAEGALIGTNATILEKLTIGSNSIIGAAAMVNKNIAANSLAVGVPAKVIKANPL